MADDDNLENPEFTGGKISHGTDGAGVPGERDVLRRARELARIDGLGPEAVDERYLEQARRELHGEATGPDDLVAESDSLADRDPVIGSRGRHTPNVATSDEQTAGEKLYAGGVDEAWHDEMRTASETLDRQERGLGADDR
ncbi:MAG: hypothetical protein JO295_06340 [Verrucomicrobia bacterium]|nr:hypothetical protein [Verrucomicrobiota bacterium]